LALGKTVRQLLTEISSQELTEWAAYYRLEPFGEMLADQRHGIATSVLANVNRDPKQRREPYKAKDFIYWDQSDDVENNGEFHADPELQSKILKDSLFNQAKNMA
jgi:hypothetical protein